MINAEATRTEPNKQLIRRHNNALQRTVPGREEARVLRACHLLSAGHALTRQRAAAERDR
jgi:hypothetical protein